MPKRPSRLRGSRGVVSPPGCVASSFSTSTPACNPRNTPKNLTALAALLNQGIGDGNFVSI